jgi:uncharacterized Ntn-hydrolase superfamily protein
MAGGVPAPEALARLLAEDPLRESRQVAMVDCRGGVAAHTGADCMVHAGDVQGNAVSCQANIMRTPDVWPDMLAAFGAASGALTQRLLAALDAAEAAGGDLRGRQSAAILVVPAQGEPWETVIALRVEDDPDPLPELARLVGLDRAYRVAGGADELMAAGRHEEAAQQFARAAALAPGSDELRFWAGLGAAGTGRAAAGLSDIRSAIETHPGWGELLRRLPADDFPGAAEVLRRLGDGAP